MDFSKIIQIATGKYLGCLEKFINKTFLKLLNSEYEDLYSQSSSRDLLLLLKKYKYYVSNNSVEKYISQFIKVENVERCRYKSWISTGNFLSQEVELVTKSKYQI